MVSVTYRIIVSNFIGKQQEEMSDKQSYLHIHLYNTIDSKNSGWNKKQAINKSVITKQKNILLKEVACLTRVKLKSIK